jgi:hypothetical protein
MLMIEFGTATVEISQPTMCPVYLGDPPLTALRRRTSVHGEWTLTIALCEWELSLDHTVLAHSESVQPFMNRALTVMRGQALSAVSVDAASGASEFTWDLGAVLRTRPAPAGTYDDEPAEQWTLRRPDDQYLAVRGDGRFRLSDSRADPDTYVWSSLRA